MTTLKMPNVTEIYSNTKLNFTYKLLKYIYYENKNDKAISTWLLPPVHMFILRDIASMVHMTAPTST